MGYYINPPDCTKEMWLETYGQRISEAEAKAHSAGDRLVVCLVDNGPFTAAGIAFDDRERDAFARPDARAKYWYIVPRGALEPYLK